MTSQELEAYDAMMADRDKWREKAEKLATTCYTWEDNWKLAVRDIFTRKENNFGLHRRNVRLTTALEDVAAHDGPGCPAGTCAKIARAALDFQNSELSQRQP